MSQIRATLSLLRRTSGASIAGDARLLADLLHRGGVSLVMRDTAGAPAARILVQPDGDVIMTCEHRCLLDPALRTRVGDLQQAMRARLASATRPLAAFAMATRGLAAAVSLLAAEQTIEDIHRWLVQAALAAAILLAVMSAEPILRRRLLRWLLRSFLK
ncbi:MAG TPA: hypothetical protein VH855_30145 [Acetobacteraceae bacterium]